MFKVDNFIFGINLIIMICESNHLFLCACSMYAELSTSANEDDPQPTVEQFLTLQAALNCVSPPPQLPLQLSEDTSKISSDKRKIATSWVHAAVATDLSPFTLYSKPTTSNSGTSSAPLFLVLETPKKTSDSPKVSSISPSSTSSTPGRARVSSKLKPSAPPPLPLPTSLPTEWVRGDGIEETTELARGLREQSRNWFLEFLDKFLGGDGRTSILYDKGQVAGMLSQLKKVNDWFDEIGKLNEMDLAADGGCEENNGNSRGNLVPMETIERLRKKIYEYLLTHVECAAVALSSGGEGAGNGSGAVGRRQ